MASKANLRRSPKSQKASQAEATGVTTPVGPSAWAVRHMKGDERRTAPGGPGVEPRWAMSAKDGVGTALSPSPGSTSLVWFTIGRGALTETFYPRVDRACTRDLCLLIAGGRDFFADERSDADHRIETPTGGVPLYRLTNVCRHGRYQIDKKIFAHPYQNALIQSTKFQSSVGDAGSYRLYVYLTPHLLNRGWGNSAWLGVHRGVPMLFARRHDQYLALASSAPWITGSAGFVGTSDGWLDLSRHKRLTEEYDRAEDGNVSLTGEVDLAACNGSFRLALAFGTEAAEAGHRALSSLLDDFGRLQAEYEAGWQNWQKTLVEPKLPDQAVGRNLFRISAGVLQTHADQSIPGAMIASLSSPWGETRGDEERESGTGGYHLVWPRDLVQSAGGLLAAGAKTAALQVLAYLRATQMADGHWPQNMWVSSASYQTGIQIGETALPILLLDMLSRQGALPARELSSYWPMVRLAAAYILRSGPSTQQDRWENQRGYTPFTLAAVIAALLIAAELADRLNEPTIGSYLRESADAWNTAVESWLYVEDTDLARQLGVDGYYVRSIPPELDLGASPRLGHVRLKDVPITEAGLKTTEVVSPDALALVRFGLRSADDPRIVATVRAIDALLKVDTPGGPSWRRYNGDLYGERRTVLPLSGRPGEELAAAGRS